MNIFQRLYLFLKKIFSSSDEPAQIEETSISQEELDEMNEAISSLEEDKIDVQKRTLMSRLYVLEQEILIFESNFPTEYHSFLEKIVQIRNGYQANLEELKNRLTFEIDPELNYIGEVVKLEKNVKKFIETEVKFDMLSKRLQRLLKKLNILYNVSIFHATPNEKEKVNTQLDRALKSATKLAHEFKTCDYVLTDVQLKERIIDLISYIDYQIFKASIRNSADTPQMLVKKLVMESEFTGFNYATAFSTFLKDEMSDLSELFPLVGNDECQNVFEQRVKLFLSNLTYTEEATNLMFNTDFWDEYLAFESTLLEMLRTDGVSKDKAEVKLIDRMNIEIDDDDVLVLPKTTTYLSLINIFSRTQDKRIWMLIKILKNLSDQITYKEIYFLFVLFDVISVIQNTPNDAFRHIEKYLKKYPYDPRVINKKKESVLNSSNKDYIVVFSLTEYEKEIIQSLEHLNIDFKVFGEEVLLNSFYFNGLDNVLNSLQLNTNNTTM